MANNKLAPACAGANRFAGSHASEGSPRRACDCYSAAGFLRQYEVIVTPPPVASFFSGVKP